MNHFQSTWDTGIDNPYEGYFPIHNDLNNDRLNWILDRIHLDYGSSISDLDRLDIDKMRKDLKLFLKLLEDRYAYALDEISLWFKGNKEGDSYSEITLTWFSEEGKQHYLRVNYKIRFTHVVRNFEFIKNWVIQFGMVNVSTEGAINYIEKYLPIVEKLYADGE